MAALLRGITSNHNGDFCNLNCFHSYRTKEKLKKYEKLCNDHDHCYVEMPDEDNKTLKYNHGENSLKAVATIYADWASLLEKMYSCENNPEKFYTEKKTKHTPSGFSLFTNCSFDAAKNKLDCYKGEDCMERFCKDLRDHAMKINNYEENKMIPLTDKEKQKICYICINEFSADEDYTNAIKLYYKVRDHCHDTGKFRGAAHNTFNLRSKHQKKFQ